ncbi:hypothetical protein Pth03_26460 [Planotetraspora thailandica]|uniref:N-acetyltransferase domain-containing protein n=1 Tax=Planotetraspora thailandica TaxID=487172 RepID=A0A8J3UZ60_9ACTN|nr:GNAT family N-acetyltransferase [Planotetraspora thailandica]GII54257.1 hypothetical protein Pth03_26460 [Planotetraspora thailandica]
MTIPEAEIRAAAPEDLKAVAEIGAYYVTNSVATFDETPRTVDEWRRWLEELAGRGLPFLVADLSGEVAGYAYAGPWRPKPPTGTPSRTRSTSPPAMSVAGWARRCSVAWWPSPPTQGCAR